jgi:hypothetical protein
MFDPHPNLSDEINNAIRDSEIAGGYYLDGLRIGKKLFVTTKHHVFTIARRHDGYLEIHGHPKYCPDPTKVKIPGSTFGGSMLKVNYVGIGMYMEFYPESYEGGKKCITTSEILDVMEA